MRGSGWVLPIVAVVIWLAVVVWPIMAFIDPLLQSSTAQTPVRPMLSLLATSVGWAAAVGVASMLIGWAPGRLLGKSLHRRTFIPIAALILVPVCLPSYVVFYAWWQSWPAASEFHHWVVKHGYMQIARQATLFVGLVCWSWPLVSLCVAGSVAGTPAQREELLRLDGAGPLRRMWERWRSDGRGLCLGGLVVFLATLANTTCFDLAEVFTFANELRAIQAMSASVRDVATTAAPAMFISGIGVVLVWIILTRPPREIASRVAPPSAAATLFTILIWVIAVMLPLTMFAMRLWTIGGGVGVFNEFVRLYRWSVVNTVIYAAVSGLIGAIISVGLFMMWQDHRRWIRHGVSVMALSWLLVAALPGVIIGVGLIAAYNRAPLHDLILNSPAILVAAHLASFGFVAALLARWLAWREPSALSDLRRLDGAGTLPGVLESARPRILTAGLATFAIIFVMAVGEIPVTALVAPPHRAGAGPLALTLLNDMHYQRPQTVMVASLGMLGCAFLAAIVVAILLARSRWRSRTFTASSRVALWTLIGVSVLNSGCTPEDPSGPAPLKPQITFGVAGIGPGQFAYPRAVDVDDRKKCVYVIDKQARVQRLGYDGVPQKQWHMPEKDNGKPTGITVAPDGRVFVADTHYFRVMAYDGDGNELMRFGEFGREPGQFIYTTDVAFGPDGRMYVSEYGGNDRVQVFNAAGHYLFAFGSFGGEHGQFNRPQAMAFNAGKTELYVADSCNHRIEVFNPDGTYLRTIGKAGRAIGELTYPYGLVVLPDRSILVAEFGNNRLQRFDEQGTSLGVYGEIGRGPGQLQYPWSLAAAVDRVFVLDSGNNRVHVMKNPKVHKPT